MMNTLIPEMKKDPLAITYALDKASYQYFIGGMLSAAFLNDHLPE